jgi:hypothetical protein
VEDRRKPSNFGQPHFRNGQNSDHAIARLQQLRELADLQKTWVQFNPAYASRVSHIQRARLRPHGCNEPGWRESSGFPWRAF